MGYIREGVTSRMIEKAKEHRKVVESLVRDGRLADAAKSIEEFEAREQATKTMLAEQTALLQDATAEAIAAVSEKIDAILKEQDPEAARGVLSELVSRLPPGARRPGT